MQSQWSFSPRLDGCVAKVPGGPRSSGTIAQGHQLLGDRANPDPEVPEPHLSPSCPKVTQSCSPEVCLRSEEAGGLEKLKVYR